MSKDKELLYEFVDNNLELELLEDLLQEFNMFEVIGMVSNEIKHSNMLAWLLNPRENHQLQDFFLKRFLKTAIKSAMNNNVKHSVNMIVIHVWDFHSIRVYREWNNIDILIEDPINQFICVMENKIFADES